jgi:hypothetical protein
VSKLNIAVLPQRHGSYDLDPIGLPTPLVLDTRDATADRATVERL